MKYKEFILESIGKDEYKKSIDLDNLVKLYKDNCKKYDLDKPFIRGYSGTSDYLIVQGDVSKRKSRTGMDYGNIIIDQNIIDVDKSYPRRQYSIIFTTKESALHAREFGSRLYYIIPYDDCKFAYCEDFDFNEVEFKNKYHPFHNIRKISDFFDMFGIKGDDFDSLVNSCYKQYNSFTAAGRIKEMFDGCESKEDFSKRCKELITLENMKIKFTTDLSKLSDTEYEIWTNGKCLMIDEDKYKEFVQMVKNNK